jgi:hypothetical protein
VPGHILRFVDAVCDVLTVDAVCHHKASKSVVNLVSAADGFCQWPGHPLT